MTDGKATETHQRIAWGRYVTLFFVAAWMFVLGVLVGRGTAPVRFDTLALQKELVALRDGLLKKERETVEKAVRGEGEKTPLGFWELLKKDAPDVAVQMPEDEPSEKLTPPPAPSTASPAATAAPLHKARMPVMAKGASPPTRPVVAPPVTATLATAPASVAPPAPAPQPVAASTPPGPPVSPGTAERRTLTIQIASLKDGEAAERIVADLKKDGYPAYLSRIVIPDKGLWFRVRVGSYEGRQQAAADLERLARDRKNPILVEK